MALQKKKKGKQKSTSHKEEACFSSTPNLKIQGKKYLKEKTKKNPNHKNQPQNQQKKGNPSNILKLDIYLIH